jgi:hypothetical protein
VHSYSPFSDEVAAAAASSHPERALDIYRRGLDAQLKQANISAYESCAIYLRKMRPIVKSLGRDEECLSKNRKVPGNNGQIDGTALGHVSNVLWLATSSQIHQDVEPCWVAERLEQLCVQASFQRRAAQRLSGHRLGLSSS